MGNRDNNLIDDRHEDEILRRLLERSGQPLAVQPPPDLVTRTLRQLPQAPPAVAARAVGRRAVGRAVVRWALAGALALTGLLGIWSVFGAGPSFALMFGDGVSGLSRVLLTLELLAKPLLRTTAAGGGLMMLAGLLALAGAGALWWRMLRRTPVVYAERAL
ncbi:MAG TPA: hypothetical protein VFU22_13305 [Roseiflexaceae bacterium]|nr:hypothetical protein [Roseiflexaceae bacterium]